jgi:hypothetical protein
MGPMGLMGLMGRISPIAILGPGVDLPGVSDRGPAHRGRLLGSAPLKK